MQKLLALLILITSSLQAASKKKNETDYLISKYAAIISSNKLHANDSDAGGLVLMRLAGALNKTDNNFLLTFALLKRGMKPPQIKTKVSEKKLLDNILVHALKLHQKELPKNPKVADLCMLYFRVVEHFRRRDAEALVALEKLKIDGYEKELDDLLNRAYDLETIYDREKKSKPKSEPEPELEPKEEFEEPPNDIFVNDKRFKDHYEASEGAQVMGNRMSFPKDGSVETKFRFTGDFGLEVRGAFPNGLELEMFGKTYRVAGSDVRGQQLMVACADRRIRVWMRRNVVVDKRVSRSAGKKGTKVKLTLKSGGNAHLRRFMITGETAAAEK